MNMSILNFTDLRRIYFFVSHFCGCECPLLIFDYFLFIIPIDGGAAWTHMGIEWHQRTKSENKSRE